MLILGRLARNQVITMGDVQAHFLDAAGTPHDAMRGYRDTLRGLTDADRFPALHALLDAGVFDRADPPDDEFAFGLERILDGVPGADPRTSAALAARPETLFGQPRDAAPVRSRAPRERVHTPAAARGRPATRGRSTVRGVLLSGHRTTTIQDSSTDTTPPNRPRRCKLTLPR